VIADDGGLALSVTPEHFAEQMDVLAREAEVLPLAEAVGERRGVAITFDDAYRDVLETAAPVLTDRGLPATVFAPTRFVAEQRSFWWDELTALVRPERGGPLRVTVDGETRAWAGGGPAVHRHLHAWLQPLEPERIAEALEQVRAWAGGAIDTDAPMTPDELARFAALPGLEVGGHSVTHRSLAHAPAATQLEEARESRRAVAEWTGRAPDAFAYPFGVPGFDFDAASMRAVREAGYAIGAANAPGRLRDALAVPRDNVPDVGGEAFADWLSARTRRALWRSPAR
jgi:peptidoglycan/xylan/chitin deacetylase (PgdA/CDA1 family)